MGTQPLVLVADDEPRITKLVSIALSEEGFRVVTASGGEEALAKAEEIRPDIVLLDIVMPDLDGIEVMRQLRERRPVPVILLTAKGVDRRQGQGPRPRRRRLHRQAVPSRRAGGPRPCRHPALDRASSRAPASSRSTTSRSTSSGGWSAAAESSSSCRGPSGCCSSTWPTNAGKVVLHTELLTKVWGPEYRDDLQYLRVWISRVRRKLGAEARRARPDPDVPGHRLPPRRRGHGRRRPRRARRRDRRPESARR